MNKFICWAYTLIAIGFTYLQVLGFKEAVFIVLAIALMAIWIMWSLSKDIIKLEASRKEWIKRNNKLWDIIESLKSKENTGISPLSSFGLTVDQEKKMSEWSHHCSTDAGAIGGRLSVTFTPTGLGVAARVECICGEKLNLTNYKEW